MRQPEQRELATVDERQLAALIPDSADTASAQRIRDLYAQLVQTRQELVAAERQRDATAAQLERAKQRALEQRRSMRQQSRHRSAAGVDCICLMVCVPVCRGVVDRVAGEKLTM